MTDQTEDAVPAADRASAEAQFISAERLVFFSDAVVAIARITGCTGMWTSWMPASSR